MGGRRNKYGASPNMEGCPVETTLDVIGGKWKGIILYHLIAGTKLESQKGKMLEYSPFLHESQLTRGVLYMERRIGQSGSGKFQQTLSDVRPVAANIRFSQIHAPLVINKYFSF